MNKKNATAAGTMASRLFSPVRLLAGLAVGLCVSSSALQAQVLYAFTNFAGLPGTSGAADGTGTVARFNAPNNLACDVTGNIYLADGANNTIRKVLPDRTVSTLAGLAGATGTTDGTNSTARFNNPCGATVDATGTVYVVDFNSHTVRRVTPDGVVQTLAGSPGVTGATDGTNGSARFNYPWAITLDNAGSLYVADNRNHTIRKISPDGTNWVVTTLAGLAGNPGSTDGTGTVARFRFPTGVTVDGSGNVYVADVQNQTIRKITPIGAVTTIVGSAGLAGSADGTNSTARFNTPEGLCVDGSGNLFLADYGNNLIRKITPVGSNWVVSTIGGTAGTSGSSDGVGSAARFNGPVCVSVDTSGTLYISDNGNHRVSKGISSAPLTAPTAQAATNITLNSFYANWDAVVGATNYLLDVATVNNFTAYVSGYSNRSVGVVTTYRVTGLNAGATYYYRVREQQGGLTSGNSATVSVVTVNVTLSTTNGPGAGGNTIIITGTGLGGGGDITNVTICGVSAAIQSQTADSVTVMVGFGGKGTGSVIVYSSSVGTTTAVNAYTYAPGPVVAWGYCPNGETNVPSGLSDVVGLAAGQPHSVALLSNGRVVAWGGNANGQTNVPSALTNAVKIVAGAGHSLALSVNGTVTAWGLNNYGQTNAPAGLSNVLSVAAGAYFSMALQANGTVVAWGANSDGQTNVPSGLSNVVAIAAGQGGFGMALRANGSVVAWGNNAYSQTNVPASVTNAMAIAAGADHGMALRSNGTVVAWGRTTYGQTSVPAGLSNVMAIACGNYHSLALQTNGTMFAWGDNAWGERTIPSGLSNVATVAAGFNDSMALVGSNAMVQVQVSPAYGGTVVGGGLGVVGARMILLAIATNLGGFVNWNDGSTENPRIVPILTNITYTANFAPVADVTVSVGAGGGGTVTGSGTFILGSNALITATASNGWWFLGWNDGSTNNPRDIVVASNVTYTAAFGATAGVATLPLPAEGGETAGDGAYVIGSNATVMATASNNWVFMNWNGSITNNPWTFVVPAGGQVCTANFSTLSTVTVLASPTNGGSVAGGGAFLSNSNIVLTATASNNWIFTAWDDAVTNNPRTITVPVTNITYTASFSPTALLTVGVGTNGGGTVTGGGTFIVGSTVQLTATASNGWGFLAWNDGGTNNPRDVVVGASGGAYTAEFAPVVTLTTLAAPIEAGTVAGGGVLFVGSNAVLSATPSNGWRFVWWNDGNTNNPRTVVVPATNLTYTASFVYPAVVTVQAVPPGGGTVTGSGTYWAGTNVTLAANAASGWLFSNWGDGNTQAVRSITVPRSNITYTANFGYSATLSVLASPASGGTVAGGGTFLNGATSSISATPYAGWVFLGWSDGNTNNPRNVTLVTGANAYTANFGSPARVGAAVNQPGMTWVLGGVAGWFDQAANARDGLAAQSGPLAAGQVSYFQTTTNGPGSLLFWWKASSAATNYLQFYVGTQLVNQISGNAGWSQVATFIGHTNPVTLTWAYAKNSAAVAGADAGWVDQVTWLPCAWATNVPQLFFQEPNGLIASWVLNATGGFEFARVLANTGSWGLKAAGDVDGDGVSDLLFQSPSGATGGWFMQADGSVRDSRFWFNIGGWEIKACGDYEGLGHAQLFFQTAAGLAAYWRLDTNGVFEAAVGLGAMGPWKLRGAGDLDGDLKAELFWQNAAGVVAIWWHNPDGSIRGTVPFGTGEWALCGVTDVDNDGVCDLIWQTPDTRTGGWFMNTNGTARSASFWWPTGGWKLKAAGR